MLPNNVEAVFWHAAALAGAGRIEEALPLFKQVFAREPKWAELVKRLPAAGLLPREAVPRIVGDGR
jgi:hypothetical protein